MVMSVKVFDSLTQKDFGNGAIRDEIRRSLRELERVSAYIYISQQTNAADGVIRCGLCGCEIEPSTVICRDCRGEP